MKYYYLVHDSTKKSKSTSFLHINSKTLDLSYDEKGYLDYSESLSLEFLLFDYQVFMSKCILNVGCDPCGRPV